MSGREAVEHFSKCYHTGKIKHMYFNVAPNRLHRPYDLIAVPKSKVRLQSQSDLWLSFHIFLWQINKEHYVFSTFGVLHVFPDQSSNNMSLADWQKEAVLFNAIMHISFFKNFILRKIFKRYVNHEELKHINKFVYFSVGTRIFTLRILQESVRMFLLACCQQFPVLVPLCFRSQNFAMSFYNSNSSHLTQSRSTCDCISRLKLHFSVCSKTYELGQFENVLHCMNRQAEKILERFYR